MRGGWSLGLTKKTDERVRLMAQTKKNQGISEENLKKMIDALRKKHSEGKWVSGMKGKHHSENAKQKIGLKNLGRKHTQESIKKILESRAKNGLWFSWNRGLTKTSDERVKRNGIKIGIATKGRVVSEESRKKMSETQKRQYASGERVTWCKGKKLSEELRKKFSLAHMGQKSWNKGKTTPIEIRKKLSESRKKVWKNPVFKKLFKERRLNLVLPKKDTSIEVKIQNALTKKGIIFQKHKAIGNHQVDLFIKPNIVVEMDGEFWHANPEKYGDIAIMYKNKTAKQIREHDVDLTRQLEAKGFFVLRFWEHDINQNLENCVMKIENAIGEIV